MSDPGFISALSGADEWARHEALRKLTEEGADPAQVERLVRALGDPSDASRRAAARMALAALASPRSPARSVAAAALREALHSRDGDVQLLAASAAGESSNAELRTALIRALEGPPNLAAAAADALGELRHPDAIGPLSERATGGDGWVRAAAVVALGRIGDARAFDALGRAAAEPGLEPLLAEAIRSIGDPAGLSILARLVDRAPDATLLAAGSILSANPDVEAPDWVMTRARRHRELLRRRLDDEDDPAAARLLGCTGDPVAVAALIEAAGPPRRSEAALTGLLAVPAGPRVAAILERLPGVDREERIGLLALLPPLQEESDIRALVPLLADPDPTVRAATAEALARARPDRALALLRGELERQGPAPDVVRALGGLGGVACQALVPLLEDLSGSVRRAAAEALARCATPDVAGEVEKALAREMEPEARGALLRALGRSAGGAAVQSLAAALESGDATVRLAAIEGLAATRHPDALPFLRQVVEAGGGERLPALRAMGDLGAAAGAPVLEPHLRSAEIDTRRVAARAAVDLAPHLAEPAVLALTRDGDEWVRVWAARILGRRGESARSRLRELAESDPAPAVRSEARRALAPEA